MWRQPMAIPMQLELRLGRVLTLPPDNIDPEIVVVELSPAQALWFGRDEPRVPSCPGCVLFGECCKHAEERHGSNG